MNMEDFFRDSVLKDLMSALDEHDFETRVKPKVIKIEVESMGGGNPMEDVVGEDEKHMKMKGPKEEEEGEEEMLVDLENYGSKMGASDEEMDPRLAKRLKQMMG